MRVMTTQFEKVSLFGCKGNKSKEFYQTISPFNRDKKTGKPKTREQIIKELKEEIKQWEAHDK